MRVGNGGGVAAVILRAHLLVESTVKIGMFEHNSGRPILHYSN